MPTRRKHSNNVFISTTIAYPIPVHRGHADSIFIRRITSLGCRVPCPRDRDTPTQTTTEAELDTQPSRAVGMLNKSPNLHCHVTSALTPDMPSNLSNKDVLDSGPRSVAKWNAARTLTLSCRGLTARGGGNARSCLNVLFGVCSLRPTSPWQLSALLLRVRQPGAMPTRREHSNIVFISTTIAYPIPVRRGHAERSPRSPQIRPTKASQLLSQTRSFFRGTGRYVQADFRCIIERSDRRRGSSLARTDTSRVRLRTSKTSNCAPEHLEQPSHTLAFHGRMLLVDTNP